VLLESVTVCDAQPDYSVFFINPRDPLAQYRDSIPLSLLLGSPDPVIGPGDCPKRPTDELDRAPHTGALLFRLAQPRQLTNSANFSRQAYKVAALYHALSAVNSRERSQLSRPTRDMENLVSAVGYL
jgi:hypothetical protein